MKLNFWAVSKRTRKRLKLFLVIMSLSCGILAAVEARYAFLRLHDIEADPGGIISEQAIWGTIKPSQERYGSCSGSQRNTAGTLGHIILNRWGFGVG